ncbi:MAG: hypothetical protein B6241_14270 [Spirochaetaceae bacterium 4572_59]|nr:MAG: hypothetical protein B6241_14270 [Spirochaetaceae bacterium 4572_59]
MSDFEQFWNLYSHSFPENERRDLDLQRQIMSHPAFQIRHYKNDDLYRGFLNTFHFTEFIFVDHLAVSPDQRGTGIGSSIMNELIESTSKPIILEVERPTSNDAVRRIDFYESLGFHLNVFDYIQPPIDEGRKAIPLFLMTYPERLDMKQFEKVRQIIHRNVYNSAS